MSGVDGYVLFDALACGSFAIHPRGQTLPGLGISRAVPDRQARLLLPAKAA